MLINRGNNIKPHPEHWNESGVRTSMSKISTKITSNNLTWETKFNIRAHMHSALIYTWRQLANIGQWSTDRISAETITQWKTVVRQEWLLVTQSRMIFFSSHWAFLFSCHTFIFSSNVSDWISGVYRAFAKVHHDDAQASCNVKGISSKYFVTIYAILTCTCS